MICVFVCMWCCRIPEKTPVADLPNLPIGLKVDDDGDIKQCSITSVVLNEQVYLTN